ncbi:class I fructose-bisphosphate aldolase [Arcicella aquatica]|uniref:fructose-bisphosphate aldolase n=1 Tax=Arcicella aquatica TaxID=217141 RepID=A0ABU5QT49_9BACT|nr:class I fructose-bisphosphate aldolase [Arcicella aquatica]MEA5259834.1 class I fructose-bisphosphate aldolase [Arcicella aquatica]
MDFQKIVELLGEDSDNLFHHDCTTFSKELLYRPSPDYISQVLVESNRNPQVLRNLASIFNHGRLAGTGYVSILPIDQDIEHTAGGSFAKNPIYFNPENILKLAMEGSSNAVATTFGNLALVARKYAHKIPFIVKINHNELLTYPTKYNQIMFGSVREAWNLGATAIGATIYFGSEESSRQIIEVSEAFEEAHSLGMPTILWCYTRNNGFKKEGINYETAADITGQANHIGVTIQADIIKQKMPDINGGFTAIDFSKSDPLMYSDLTTKHPIDLCRYQVANCYMGRIGLINSGGESKGASDLVDSIKNAIINKRAGGMGMILGRKAFQRTFADGVELLHAVQDVYLAKEIGLA